MVNNKNINDITIKHLEFIQNIITRLGTNSFLIKGWTVTIFSALIALFATNEYNKLFYLVIYIIPIILFWYLDAYYLQQERKFKGIYNDVAYITPIEIRHGILPFDMPVKLYSGGDYSFLKAFWSKTICPLYLIIIFTILFICLFDYYIY
jgi:hypothetical protein